MLGYLKFYLANFKVLLFIQSVWKYRKLVLAILRKYLNQVKAGQILHEGTS
jgi:hypothetical protein